MKQLSNKLMLQSVEANNWKHDDEGREIVTCFQLNFTFCGFDGFSAFITDTSLLHDFPHFQFIESEEGDLHDSFSDQIDTFWSELVKSCNEFSKQHFEDECKLVGCFA